MKTIKGLLVMILLILMVSCNRNPGYNSDNYRVITGPDGRQMVVVYDNNGQQMLLDYVLFQQAMNSGGYGSVMNYRNRFVPYNNSYNSWRSSSIPRNNYNYYQQNDDEPINVTESQSNTRKYGPSYSSPSSGSSLRTPGGYSSGNVSESRSSLRTPTPSYNVPKYSSPSPSSSLRTPSSSGYISPSRTYSSPSSSFRSPSSTSRSSSLRSPR